MKEKINEMRKYMESQGIISPDDIALICKIEMQYETDCISISEQCEAEGFPAHGSNYELRCEAVRKSYDEEIEAILSSYDFGEEEE